jgi:hypothetical protein
MRVIHYQTFPSCIFVKDRRVFNDSFHLMKAGFFNRSFHFSSIIDDSSMTVLPTKCTVLILRLHNIMMLFELILNLLFWIILQTKITRESRRALGFLDRGGLSRVFVKDHKVSH